MAPKTTAKTATKAAKSPPCVGEGEGKKTLSPVPMPLVKRVADTLGDEIGKVTLKDIKAICEAFVKTIVQETLQGSTVALPNFMTFKRVLRNQRTHKNPKTKEEIVKPAHYVLTMDVKAQLKKSFEGVEVVAKPVADVCDQVTASTASTAAVVATPPAVVAAPAAAKPVVAK